MIDTKELRQVAVDCYWPTSPVPINEILDRLEAAEEDGSNFIVEMGKLCTQCDALRAELTDLRNSMMFRTSLIGRIEAEREDLHELIAALIKQVNAEFRLRRKKEIECNALCAKVEAMKRPTPSVPTALLVAVANLVAQMEIVSRVGFVDTPNDKDSCAAFCVAEGTWLELMSAVESLASALAAAPEAKP